MIDLPHTEPNTATRQLAVRFTGSGSEYFRIWIVNLLLIVITVGLYIPFAKARRIRYFYANTLVDDQALAFHGDPWRMFRGFLLMLVLMGAYSASGHISPYAAFFAFLVLCAIWPALWRSSLRFRLGNTSWRGLRLAFRGDLSGAYKAVAPVYVATIPMLLLPLLLPQGRPEAMPAWFGFSYALVLISWLFFWPWGLALIKRYQHRGYALGSENGRIELSTGSIYGLAFKGLGMSILLGIVAGVVFVIIGGAIMGTSRSGGPAGFGIAGIVLIALVYLAMGLIYGCWAPVRLQNMVWSGTSSEHLRFESRLSARAYALLCIKNWLLTVVTLGLYRPFAVVAASRMRLEAVSVELAGGIDALVANAEASYQDATGDASGDFFGIDLGL